MEFVKEFYVEAFARFTNSVDGDFELRADGHHALAKFKYATYRISHSKDLAADYEEWFTSGHDLLFTEIPAGLWNDFLVNMDPFKDDFLIDLYESWKTYWEHQAGIYDKHERYAAEMDNAHQHFELLCEKLSIQDGLPVELAWEIDDQQLLPVVALAVKRHYRNDPEFFYKCATLMSSKYKDQLGNGHVFGDIMILMPGYTNHQPFYIYAVDEMY